MTSRIIVAVNAILVVSLQQTGEFLLQETSTLLGHRIQQVLANLHFPVGTTGSGADSQARCTLLQCVIGEDLDEEESTVHCHIKLECSSREQALYAIDKLKPLFFHNSASGSKSPLSTPSTHSSPPLSSKPPLEWNVWMVAPESPSSGTADCPPNPKVIPPGTTALFCLNANLHIQPDHREELLTLLEHARSESMKEPLCIEYQYGESLDIPNTFHVHQEYMGDNGGKDGFDKHATTPHYKKWKEFANDEDRFSNETEGYTFRRTTLSKSDMKSEQNPHYNNKNDCILLDGGTGHELKQRGVITDGSFLAGLLANERQPAIVQSVHSDFVCHGGCRVLTTNSFVAVPERVRQDILLANDASSVSQDAVHQRTRELILAAVKCARTVANKHDGVQVAGTVPPLTECYQASLVPTDPDDMVPIYRLLLATLIQEGVDILLAETLSTSREVIAIVRALSELNQKSSTNSIPPLWIALTIDDFQQPTTLRSGEPLDVAMESILNEATERNIKVGAIGVNCASPNSVTRAIPLLLAATKKTNQRPLPRVMAYANAFRTTTSEWLASITEDSGDKSDNQILQESTGSMSQTENQIDEYDSGGILLPEVYGRYAKEWQTLGASIIGGCCGCSPIHLKAAAEKLGVLH